MFFFEFLLFVIIILLSSISLSGYGAALANNNKINILEEFFFGFLLTSLIVTLFHFFLKINFIVIFFIVFVGVTIFFLKKRFQLILNTPNKKIYFILLILIPIYISQKYHEDFGYYHLPHIINLYNEKIIFGLANSNIAFIHNSLWLNILNLFYSKNLNFVNIPTFLLYAFFIIFSANEMLNNNKNRKLSIYFLIICILYIILKYTRISEFGNDIPSLIFAILSIYNFFKFDETTDLQEKKFIFFSNFSFTIFAILIKFSCIPLLILPFYLFIKNYKFLFPQIFKYNYFLIYLLTLLFFFQQFVYSGCFVFPSNYTCIEVSWFNNDFIELKKKLELINKNYFQHKNFYSKEEYLQNFTWVSFWLKRNYSEILEHLATIITPLTIILILSKKNMNKKNYFFKSNNISIFSLFIFFGFVFWFNFSPVYRFGALYFLSLIFLITFQIYRIKIISNNILFSVFIICLLFNFSKNISRIINENDIFFGVKKINNKFIEISNNNIISINKPDTQNNSKNGWQGRLCWDIEFLCSYKQINVDKKYGYLIISKLQN